MAAKSDELLIEWLEDLWWQNEQIIELLESINDKLPKQKFISIPIPPNQWN